MCIIDEIIILLYCQRTAISASHAASARLIGSPVGPPAPLHGYNLNKVKDNYKVKNNCPPAPLFINVITARLLR